MTNREAIEFLKNMIDREAIGFVCPEREGDVAICQYHVEALQMAISALQEQEAKHSTGSSLTQKALDTISRQAAIDAMEEVDWYHINKDGQLIHGANSKEDEPLHKAEDVYKVLNDMPSAQPDLPIKEKCAFCPHCNNCDVNDDLSIQPCVDTISRQAAIDELKAAYWDKNIQSAKDDPCIVDAMTDWAIRKIKGLPSAQPDISEYSDKLWKAAYERGKAEAEIIRCKECKHRDPEDHKCDCGHDILWQLPRNDEWYCADAERKEGEKDG